VPEVEAPRPVIGVYDADAADLPYLDSPLLARQPKEQAGKHRRFARVESVAVTAGKDHLWLLETSRRAEQSVNEARLGTAWGHQLKPMASCAGVHPHPR
jgi:hypothetical protein